MWGAFFLLLCLTTVQSKCVYEGFETTVECTTYNNLEWCFPTAGPDCIVSTHVAEYPAYIDCPRVECVCDSEIFLAVVDSAMSVCLTV